MAKINPYEVANNFIIEKLEKGVCPWKRPWACVNGEFNTFYNFISKKPYRGINPFILSTAMYDYSTPYFLTYNQCKKLGGTLIKGSKGFPVLFFSWIKKKDENGKETKSTFPMLKYFNVFNVEQCEGLDLSKVQQVAEDEASEFNSISECEEIIENYENGPTITSGGNEAYYKNGIDTVNLPKKENFNNEESYYCTMFHELVHSTGNHKRLDREFGKSFGDVKYSKEELIAEMGSCFLSSVAGISEMVIDNQASYIANWLKALKNDPKLLVQASGMAQKAANHILGKTVEYTETKAK